MECLRQVGELSKHHNNIVQVMSGVQEMQQGIEGNLLRVERTLVQKVDKEEMRIPDDLQDQLAMLKKGKANKCLR